MKILITGAWQGFRECEDKIKKMGHEICFLQWEKDPLPCEPEWPEAIIGNGIFMHHPIEQFVNLRFIQITSAGFDRVPMGYIRKQGIEIHNARGVYSIPMAEYALGGVLQLYKRFSEYGQSQINHQWKKINPVRELYGRRVCIIGCGSVGTECAKRFKDVGCKVEGIDLYPFNHDAFDRIEGLSGLDEVIREVDILILTVPLEETTKNLLNRNRISSLKAGSTVVNIARGGVMDYQAFIELAPEKHLSGVFDVFEEEPLSADNLLWDMENVIVTPHNSFQSVENRERLNELVKRNLKI